MFALEHPGSILFTWRGHVGDRPLGNVSHESHDGEDNKAGEHAGEGVNAADDYGVPTQNTQGY